MTLKVTLILASTVALAIAEKLPEHKIPRSYFAPTQEPEYPTEPPKYAYNYDVADDYTGASFAASESRDGYKTVGSYKVNLPDGRIQTVKYVDNGNGLEAEVTYEGEARYPEYKPAPKYKKTAAAPAPSQVYKPAPAPDPVPVYKPAPAPSYEPDPVPVYKPAPVPAPVPGYKPAPAPVSAYEAASDEELDPDQFRVPVYTTAAAAPATIYRPTLAPAPYPVPVYESNAVPVHKPSSRGSSGYRPGANTAPVYDPTTVLQQGPLYRPLPTLYE
ncbi:adhesive plaque matrix protein-like [Macrobrachium nipponense]|uniref:adhesive plaque matrix protein-like n=1 Tax=Macrobrachium nipponense TaxID=159736 RepID=UPI0030C83B70